MKQIVENVRHQIGRSGLLFGTGLILWCVWVVFGSLVSPYPFDIRSPYLASALGLVVGGVVGALLRRYWLRGGGIPFLALVVIATAISWPIYANASAAVGGLLVALAGLAAFDVRMRFQHSLVDPGERDKTKYRTWWQVVIVAATVVVGIYLALDSQAAIALTLPVILIAGLAVWKQVGPSKRLPAGIGLLVVVLTACTVVFLGSRDTWPDWLADGGSLSGARHTLWSDALNLWATGPVAGSGPGSFTPSSELASNEPSLAAVHSLLLQVGSELGVIGVVLLGVLFVGGLLVAARGSSAVALIAMAAWTALAVHSSIDHLEDFPIVAVMAGVILGWSWFRARTT